MAQLCYIAFATLLLLCSCSSRNISTDDPGYLYKKTQVDFHVNIVKISHHKKEKFLQVWLTFEKLGGNSVVLKDSSLVLFSDYNDEFSSKESYDGPIEEGKEYLYSFENYPKKIRECLWGEGRNCKHEIKITGIVTSQAPEVLNFVEGNFYMEKQKEREPSVMDSVKKPFSYMATPLKSFGGILFIPLAPLAIPMILGTLK